MIAETGDRFADFAPYVPAIDDRGCVAFSAALTDGGWGVFRHRNDTVTAVAAPSAGGFDAVCSHPDADAGGNTCFYASGSDDVARLFRAFDGDVVELSSAAGPLGPTVNAEGTIGFRAPLAGGGEGVFSYRAGEAATVADTTGSFARFHGLPVVDGAGRVVFRADGRDGREGIYRYHDGRVEAIAETGERFRSLGLFPYANDGGVVAFCGELHRGAAAVFRASNGEIDMLVDSQAGFESIRGALLDDRDRLVFYATPPGGALGIYTGPDPAHDLLLGVGTVLLDSTVDAFVLNPVSINAAGQFVIRVALASGRQLMVRADPFQAITA